MNEEREEQRVEPEERNSVVETLIPDQRSSARPAYLVEEKLRAVLNKTPFPARYLQTAQRLRPR